MGFNPFWQAGDFIPCLPVAEHLALQSIGIGAPPFPPGTVPDVAWDAIFIPGVVASATERRRAWMAIWGGSSEVAEIDGSSVGVMVFPAVVAATVVFWIASGRFSATGGCNAPRFP